VLPMLRNIPTLRVAAPHRVEEELLAQGVDAWRLVKTDALHWIRDMPGVLIEGVAAARPRLDWTPEDGHPYLGFLLKSEDGVIYYSGESTAWEGLAESIEEWKPNAAIICVGESAFSPSAAANLAEHIHARWLIPMPPENGDMEVIAHGDFVFHMLGHRPAQRFKLFTVGEGWTLPSDEETELTEA
jgi:hypothetical protein